MSKPRMKTKNPKPMTPEEVAATDIRDLERHEMVDYGAALGGKLRLPGVGDSPAETPEAAAEEVSRVVVFRTPLDFTYCEMRCLTEMRSVSPRGGPKRVLEWIESTKDKPEKGKGKGKGEEEDAKSKVGGGSDTAELAAGGMETPRDGSGTARARPGDVGVPSALRLNNNALHNLKEHVLRPSFDFVLRGKFDALKWLDLSFNKISVIDKALVQCCPQLALLYLHANAIEDFNQVAVLKGLKGLKTLTLHGNGIENAPQYRFRVGCLVSKSLRTLDFSPLTIIDKDSASTWSKSQTPRGIRTPRR